MNDDTVEITAAWKIASALDGNIRLAADSFVCTAAATGKFNRTAYRAVMACLELWLLLTQRNAILATPVIKRLIACICLHLATLCWFRLPTLSISRDLRRPLLVFLRFPLVAIFTIYALRNAVSRNRLLSQR